MRTPEEIAEESDKMFYPHECRSCPTCNTRLRAQTTAVNIDRAEIAKRCQEILDIDIKDAIKIKVAIEVLKEELEGVKK